VGGLEKNKHRSKRKHVGTGGAGKEAVFSLVERGGKVPSHHVPAVTAATLRPIHESTFVMTDEGVTAKSLGRGFENRARSQGHCRQAADVPVTSRARISGGIPRRSPCRILQRSIVSQCS
jgi:hypothetical protein